MENDTEDIEDDEYSNKFLKGDEDTKQFQKLNDSRVKVDFVDTTKKIEND